MEVKGGSLRGAKKIQDSQGFNAMWGKNTIALNGRYRLFFRRTFDEQAKVYDLVVAMCPSRKLNQEKLGKSLVVLKNYEMDEESEQITDNSGLEELHKISKVLHEGRMLREMSSARDAAAKDAKDLGLKEIDEKALEKNIADIQLAYKGNPDAKPNPIYPKESLLVGRKELSIYTDVAILPVDDKSNPEWNKLVIASLPLNKKKIEKLLSMLDTAENIHDDKNFLEVSYCYAGATRQEAGMNNTFESVPQSSSQSTLFPDLWKANCAALDRLGDTAEIIKNKCVPLSKSPSAEAIKAAFEAAISKEPGILAYINMEDDETKRNAKLLLDSGLLERSPLVKERFENLVAEMKAEAEANGTAVETEAPAEEETKNKKKVTDKKLAEASEITSMKQLGDSIEELGDAIPEEQQEDNVAEGISQL